MFIVGLTGGIATGKSTVTNYLKSLDYPIIDTDIISRQVVEIGTEGLTQIVQTFGPDLLQTDGSLIRSKLGNIIFNNEDARRKLNGIVHPLVYSEVEKQLNIYKSIETKIVIVDVPLLFETNRTDIYDEIWLVYTRQTIQLERLMNRNQLSKSEAVLRINSQISIEDKKNLTDILIDNNGSIEETYEQIDQQLSRLNQQLSN